MTSARGLWVGLSVARLGCGHGGAGPAPIQPTSPPPAPAPAPEATPAPPLTDIVAALPAHDLELISNAPEVLGWMVSGLQVSPRADMLLDKYKPFVLRIADLRAGKVIPIAVADENMGGSAWAPDGSIVYTGWVNGEMHLIHRLLPIPTSGPVGTSDSKVVVSNRPPAPGQNASTIERPVVSGDGQWVAYASRTDQGPPSLIYLRIDGTDAVSLTQGELPVWSPDGSKLAFIRVVDNVRRLFMIDIATRGETQLTSGETDAIYPTWSPDGSKVAFEASQAGKVQLAYVNVADQSLTMVTDGPPADQLQAVNPSWASDGRIYFKVLRVSGGTTTAGPLYRVSP
jgi:hypothetical protein